MAKSVFSHFAGVFDIARRGERSADFEAAADFLIASATTLSEGDISVDLMRRICGFESLELRGQFGAENWYDLVSEVNTGIPLYYLVEEGRLWQVIERRYRRKQALASITNRIPTPLSRHVPVETPGILRESHVDDQPRHGDSSGRAAPSVSGPRGRGLLGPKSIELFLSEARVSTAAPKAMFARYIGRALLAWLECGSLDQPFPDVASYSQDDAPRSRAIRVASSVAVAAEVNLSPAEIENAWSVEVRMKRDAVGTLTF